MSAGMNGIWTAASQGTIGARKKLSVFCAGLMVRSAHTYAPIAIKPAWPSENSPVNPLRRFIESASTM